MTTETMAEGKRSHTASNQSITHTPTEPKIVRLRPGLLKAAQAAPEVLETSLQVAEGELQILWVRSTHLPLTHPPLLTHLHRLDCREHALTPQQTDERFLALDYGASNYEEKASIHDVRFVSGSHAAGNRTTVFVSGSGLVPRTAQAPAGRYRLTEVSLITPLPDGGREVLISLYKLSGVVAERALLSWPVRRQPAPGTPRRAYTLADGVEVLDTQLGKVEFPAMLTLGADKFVVVTDPRARYEESAQFKGKDLMLWVSMK